MVALVTGTNRPYRYKDQLQFKVAANVNIYQGALLQLDGGYVLPARAGAGTEDDRVIGVADETVDNTGGSAGDKSVLVRLGDNCLFRCATNVDLADANIGTIYDVLDDTTLQATAANAAPAGRLVHIEATRLGWFDLYDTFARP